MAVTSEQVKALRDATGVSVMECKKALEEAGGDLERAKVLLQERAGAAVGKKQGRELGAGTVAAYVHATGEMGAMVLLACETDFVSKNQEFSALARELAMHVAAMRPGNPEELMGQPFIKDQSKTVADLISAATQKFGERIEVSKFDCLFVR